MTLKINLRSLVQLVSAIDLKSNQLIAFLKVIGSILKNDLKNEFKVIGSTCEHYRFKIEPNN